MTYDLVDEQRIVEFFAHMLLCDVIAPSLFNFEDASHDDRSITKNVLIFRDILTKR